MAAADGPSHRVHGKSPVSKVRLKASSASGIGRLESGEEFISSWPSFKRLPAVHVAPEQSLEEAAERWLSVGLRMAVDKAGKMQGSSLLLSARRLRCSSNFTGLLC